MAPALSETLLICLTLASLLAFSFVMAQGNLAGVPCGSTSCLNGGTCVNNMCVCTGTGYTGVQCEILAGISDFTRYR